MRQSVSSELTPIKLAIFTATRWESRSVQDAFTVETTTTMAGVRCVIGHYGQANIFLFQSGIGPQKAHKIAQSVLHDKPWDLVVSSGFAGALVSCAIGNIIVGQNVVMDELGGNFDSMAQTSITCDDAFRKKAHQVARTIDDGSQSGKILCLPRIIGTGVEKKILAARTQAVALDMESAPLGTVAQEKNIPFMVVRTISDLVDEDLPIDFNLFLHRSSWAKGVGMILKRPTSLIEFLYLRRHMLEASRKLTMFFQEFFAEISHADVP